MKSSVEHREGSGAARVVAAAVLDVALVVVFAASGRSSHAEALNLAGIWGTAWPFLVGLAVAWFAARIWRRPAAILRSGLPAWIGTVALGLLVRVLFTDGGAALPFVLVASGVLGLFLLGWRAVWAAAGTLARRTGRDRRGAITG